jgi:hypothetical protein
MDYNIDINDKKVSDLIVILGKIPCIKLDNIKENFNEFNVLPIQIKRTFYNECNNHFCTRYHNEGLDVHLIAVSIICKNYAPIFYDKYIDNLKDIISQENFTKLCYYTGLFHDIGKPLAKINGKKHPIYTGHAQIGTFILDNILNNFNFKEELLWAINHHMCSCTHLNDISLTNKVTFPIITSDLVGNNILSYILLSILTLGDQLGRIDLNYNYDTEYAFNYSCELFESLLNHDISKNLEKILNNIKLNSNDKTFIIMYGQSCSGKSYFAKLLKDKLKNLDVIICERDNALYEAYKNNINNNIDNLEYKDIYDAVYEKDKKLVQLEWCKYLDDAFNTNLNKKQIIIIDSCQPLFPSAWQNTINSLSEEAKSIYINAIKIGFYTVPRHMITDLDDTYKQKTDVLKYLPIEDNNGYWPNISSETGKISVNNLTYATGSFNQLIKFIETINIDNNINLTDNKQFLLDKLLNDLIVEYPTYNYEQIINLFIAKACDTEYNINENSNGYMLYKIEQETDKNKLIVFSYVDGLQKFNDITRDYRGEGLIYNIDDHKFYIVRPSLPVFPEMTNITKDHKAIPYLLNDEIWSTVVDKNSPYFNLINTHKPKKFTELYMVPKYDGSLFNLTFIHNTNKLYNNILDIINNSIKMPKDCKSYYIVNDGIFIFGSKGTVFSKYLVNTRIHNAILGSYESIEIFLNLAQQSIYKYIDINNITTLHFEAIDKIPTSELTVVYDKAWCPFFGMTFYNNETNKKQFKLFDKDNIDLTCLGNIIKIDTSIDINNQWLSVKNIFNDSYEKLLNGSLEEEPEGYVISIFDGELWYPIKYKHKIYYVAHKPESKHNMEMAKEITSNSKYALLKNRLAKFREKPSIEEILLEIDFTNKFKLIIENAYINNDLSSKKNWAIYWKINNTTDTLKLNLNELLIFTYESLSVHYQSYIEKLKMPLDKLVFRVVMQLYDVPITLEKLIEVI